MGGFDDVVVEDLKKALLYILILLVFDVTAGRKARVPLEQRTARSGS